MRFDLIKAGEATAIGNIYPMTIVNQIKKTIEKKMTFVVLGVPDAQPNFDKIVGNLENPIIRGGVLSAELVLLPGTPYHDVIVPLLDGHTNGTTTIGVRLSGVGTMKEPNSRVIDTYKLSCGFITAENLEIAERPDTGINNPVDDGSSE